MPSVGDCHMLKHVWKKEFKDQCRQDMTCKTFNHGNDDLNLTLNGPENVDLLLGYYWHDLSNMF